MSPDGSALLTHHSMISRGRARSALLRAVAMYQSAIHRVQMNQGFPGTSEW